MVSGVAKAGYRVKFLEDERPRPGDSGGPVRKIWGASIGLISSGHPGGEEILVEPLLTPRGMKHGKVRGALHHPQMRPLRLKLGQ